MTEISNTLDARPIVPSDEYNTFEDIIRVDTIDRDSDSRRGFIETIDFNIFNTEHSCSIGFEAVINKEIINDEERFRPLIYIRTSNCNRNIIDNNAVNVIHNQFPTRGRRHEDVHGAIREADKVLYELSRKVHTIPQQ